MIDPWIRKLKLSFQLSTKRLPQKWEHFPSNFFQDIFNDWSERNKADERIMESNKKRSSLPIFAMKEEIMEAIHNNPVVLIRGNTGCGKTTQVNYFPNCKQDLHLSLLLEMSLLAR